MNKKKDVQTPVDVWETFKIKKMTEEKFTEINSIFNRLVSERDLDEKTSIIEGNSVVDRVNEKCKDFISKDLMVYLTIFNRIIYDDKFEDALDFKKWILNNC